MSINMFTKARSDLLLNRRELLAAFALRLNVVEDESHPSAWTDGRKLGINPSWFVELSLELRQTVMAEAGLSCALGHFWRRAERDKDKWQVASDIVVYAMLKEFGMAVPAVFEALPKDLRFLLNPQFNVETVYAKLPDIPTEQLPLLLVEVRDASPEQGDGDGDGEGEGDGDGEGRSSDEGGIEELKNSWESALQMATVSGQLAGSQGANRLREIANARSVIDWRQVMRNFLTTFDNSEYSWSRPNRRYTHQGLYLPRLRSMTVGTLAVLIDTSASISQSLLSQFAAELNAIHSRARPKEIVVLYVDTRVAATQTFGQQDRVKLTPKGGGGTDFKPGFDYLKAKRIEPACAIYLTDLFSSSYPAKPAYPVLWVVPSNHGRRPPFGQVAEVLA